MKKSALRLTVIILAGGLLSGGCFRQDIVTWPVFVPGLKSADCGRIIQESLTRVDGVRAVQIDPTGRVVRVTYDSRRLARRNVEFIIAGAGFAANDIPAKPEARAALPPACQ